MLVNADLTTNPASTTSRASCAKFTEVVSGRGTLSAYWPIGFYGPSLEPDAHLSLPPFIGEDLHRLPDRPPQFLQVLRQLTDLVLAPIVDLPGYPSLIPLFDVVDQKT